ncbi:uncharacterized protein BDZ99DRAFT_461486 [Mytilinidion resinicola]|uniref:Uncharacterized protein n=1 Tax=Mytilinidion resinicola TaxID=574789 RepID=A0A6A6YTS2_9PEZI|nr:uncharacterized protein BDZ99DRAFT_461486 [Mytilinidion resinicola]KAF2811414.1 hypothetical protein BDZ99DRAFT_461486 [Mytilinidion resinicola]
MNPSKISTRWEGRSFHHKISIPFSYTPLNYPRGSSLHRHSTRKTIAFTMRHRRHPHTPSQVRTSSPSTSLVHISSALPYSERQNSDSRPRARGGIHLVNSLNPPPEGASARHTHTRARSEVTAPAQFAGSSSFPIAVRL